MTVNRSVRRPAAALDSADRLGKLLVKAGMIKPAVITDALKYQKIRKIKLGQALIELGFASFRKIAYALSIQLNLPYITIRNLPIKDEVRSLIPREIVRDFQIIPLKKVGHALFLVVAEPPVKELLDALSKMTKMPIHLAIAPQDEVVEAIEKYYPTTALRGISIGVSSADRLDGRNKMRRAGIPFNHGKPAVAKQHKDVPATASAAGPSKGKAAGHSAATIAPGAASIGKDGKWQWPEKTNKESGTDRKQAVFLVNASGGEPGNGRRETDVFNISKPAVTIASQRTSPAFGGDRMNPDRPEMAFSFPSEIPPLKNEGKPNAAELFEMGLSALNDGAGDAALPHFEAALALEPDNRVYRANLERLKKLNAEQERQR